MIAIKNAVLVMRDHLIPQSVVLLEDGVIQAFGREKDLPIPEHCEHIIDADGCSSVQGSLISTPTLMEKYSSRIIRPKLPSITSAMAPPRCCQPFTPASIRSSMSRPSARCGKP